ncbi:MAG: replicative DNA helicase [Dehalococcoidia bacterium]
MNDDRMPPHDLGAEEAVLGSLLIDSDAIRKVIDSLKPVDFYRDKNQWVYEAICSLCDREEAINQITVAHELNRVSRLESIGGPDYLDNLVLTVPTSVHIEHYAGIVQRLSLMRALVNTADRIAEIGYDAPPDTEVALDNAENLLLALRNGKSWGGFVPLGELIDDYYDKVSFEVSTEEEAGLPCVDTGFYQLDQILGGMYRSNLVILAARPGMGKSSLAVNIARNVAVEQKGVVGLFSLEMSKEELARRFLAAESGVNSKFIGKGPLTSEQLNKLMPAFQVLSNATIYLDDSGNLTDTGIKSKARRLQDRHNLDLLIIDYIQLMRTNRRIDNRVQEMTSISQSLKELARDLNVPVLALSQLSRAVEKERGKGKLIPRLSDLRDSGSIEQDADIVIFIYRDEVYKSEEDWFVLNPNLPYPRGEADIIVEKHRNGPRGDIKLHFDSGTTRFENVAMMPPEEGQKML